MKKTKRLLNFKNLIQGTRFLWPGLCFWEAVFPSFHKYYLLPHLTQRLLLLAKRSKGQFVFIIAHLPVGIESARLDNLEAVETQDGDFPRSSCLYTLRTHNFKLQNSVTLLNEKCLIFLRGGRIDVIVEA